MRRGGGGGGDPNPRVDLKMLRPWSLKTGFRVNTQAAAVPGSRLGPDLAAYARMVLRINKAPRSNSQ